MAHGRVAGGRSDTARGWAVVGDDRPSLLDGGKLANSSKWGFTAEHRRSKDALDEANGFIGGGVPLVYYPKRGR